MRTATRSGRGAPPATNDLATRYRAVREASTMLCAPLAPEDMTVQPMPDASPAKWHLAHTTWFFETFVLKSSVVGYRSFHPQFEYLFNSYYNAVGPQWYRPHRGLLTRPTVAEVLEYRAHVDATMARVLETGSYPEAVVELGLHHEQQHQELILTDVKYLLAQNPLRPVYRQPITDIRQDASPPLGWIEGTPGLHAIGFPGLGFAFDNESPRHDELLRPYRIADRLVTNGEYREFIADGGYRRPELWLSDGWAVVRERGWQAPLYWFEREDGWWIYTLAGFRGLTDAEPVCHVSFYESDAYARWRGARLPTEAEWEVAAASEPIRGNFVEGGRFHPVPGKGGARQFFGDAWEWTASPYLAYPGYRPVPGALGEYNAKFMCNQFVLRGGSCATPRSHIRVTYRNFFPPDARWQFSGIRLAADA
ncbi:MAG: ergothioneine biosynthesis protein EgtB [Gemmatimonadales bacterium]